MLTLACAAAGASSASVARRIGARRAITGVRRLLRRAALAADRGHGPRGLAEAGFADSVLQLLTPDGVADLLRDLVVGRAGAQQLAQVGLVHGEEACAQLALGRQPDAVAVRAERLRDRVDEADLALAVGEPEDTRGRAGLARELLERMDGVDELAQLLAGEDLVLRPGVVAVQRHELDE